MNLFTYEYISMIILFIVAIKEYELLYKFSGNIFPYDYSDRNSNIIDMTVKIIFNKNNTWGRGELIVFMYPITFILIGLNTLLFLYINNLVYIDYLIEFVVITTLVISLHVIVPYYFTYIKYYEESLRKNVPFKEWLLIAVTMIHRNEDKTTFSLTSEDSIKKSKEFILNKNYTKLDYKRYELDFFNLKDYLFSENIDFELEVLTEKKFIEYIRFFTNYNSFAFSNKTNSEVEIFLDSEDIEIINTDIGLTKMHNSIFAKVDLNLIYLSRFIEISMYFAIINLIIHYNK